jgi:hypothetical protein
MSFIQNLFTSRDNNANASTYVGQQDRIWWDPNTNSFYYSDGSTPGGIAIGAGGNPFNQLLNTFNDVTFANVTVTGNLNADLGNISNIANISVLNTANLGNITIYDQTISGTIDSRDVNIAVVGNGNVNIDGPLNVHGAGNLEAPPQFEVNSDGQSIFRVSTLTSNLGAVQIVGTTSGAIVPPGNDGGMLQITGQNNQVSRVYNDAVNNYPLYVGRRYNGTALAPTGVLVNQVISRLGANPYLTDTAGFTPLGVAQINFVATENQTTTAQGSKITMNTTPTGSNVQSQVAEFNYGGIILTGNLLPTTDDVYSLGNASLRWVAAHFGNAGIYIQDNTLGDDGQLQLDNGILNFDNIDSLRVGNLQFTSTGIITTIDPALDVLIGNPGDTGNTVIRNAGIKFTDNTIQTTAAIPLAQKGNANGVVPLNASTKIDPIYLPAGAITFKGVWDAANNSPTLADGVGTVGDEYVVGVAGTRNLGSGNISFAVGDFVLYTSGNVWVDIPVGGSGVSSFNGRTGAVTLQSGDVTNALSDGSIVNSKLLNSDFTVTTGTGLGGGQVVPLGGTITLTNTGVTAAVAGTGVAVSAATGNVTFSIGQAVGTANTVQFAAITSTTTIQATGNITGGNIATGGRVVATGNIVTSANIVTPGTVINSSVSTTGNIIGANLVTGGLVTATGNITGGNLSTGGLVNATGNVSGGNVIGQNLTAGRVAIVGAGKEITTDADFTYNSSTNTLTVAGNINADYFNGNVSSANLPIASTTQLGVVKIDGSTIVIANGVISAQQTGTANANVANITVQGTIGYNLAVDDGGNVVQLTNKGTAVTCNGRTGRITTSSSALSGGGSVTFVVNNTYVQQYDLIILNVKDPVRANTYHAQVNGVGTNSFNIMVRNVDNNAHSDAIVLSFAVIQVR